jgi:transcription-repair coupling factor (superfamily II helicase)
MVSEAVAELKGEEVREPAEVKLDLTLDANLPVTYVGKEELRLEAYRRLAVVTTHEEVDDIRTEWEDRYGPVPPPAEALLAVAHLRAECARLDVREVNVVKASTFGGPGFTARISPLTLKASQAIRLKRLSPKGVYKEEIGQLVLPVKGGDGVAAELVALLQELIPVQLEATA